MWPTPYDTCPFNYASHMQHGGACTFCTCEHRPVVTGALSSTLQIMGSTPHGSKFKQTWVKRTPLIGYFLDYTCNHPSRFQRDACVRRHVSQALNGTSRVAGLRSVSRPVHDNAAEAVFPPELIFFLMLALRRCTKALTL